MGRVRAEKGYAGIGGKAASTSDFPLHEQTDFSVLPDRISAVFCGGTHVEFPNSDALLQCATLFACGGRRSHVAGRAGERADIHAGGPCCRPVPGDPLQCDFPVPDGGGRDAFDADYVRGFIHGRFSALQHFDFLYFCWNSQREGRLYQKGTERSGTGSDFPVRKSWGYPGE